MTQLTHDRIAIVLIISGFAWLGFIVNWQLPMAMLVLIVGLAMAVREERR